MASEARGRASAHPVDPAPPPEAAGLGRAAVRGAGWVVGGRWALRLSNVLCVIVLARTLSVHDYGLVAIANLTLAFISALGTAGLQAALIPLPASIAPVYWHVAWTYERLLIKSSLALGLLVFAEPLAVFANAPAMAPVFQVLALCPVLEAMESYAAIALVKQLAYRRRCLLEITEGAISMATLLVLVWSWASVWAFVISLCAGKAARVVVSYLLYPVRPRLVLAPATLRELVPFGKWLFAIQFLTKLRQHLDRLLVAGILGAPAMAIFSVGSRFSAQLISDFNDNAVRLLMPIYAKMQGAPEKLTQSFEYVMELLFFSLLPAGVGLAFVADPLIICVFGEKWASAVPIAQILALAATLRIINCSASPLFRGTGTPALEFLLSVFHLGMLVPLAFLLTTTHGLVGMATAALLAEAATVAPWLYLLRWQCGVQLHTVLRSVSWPALATLGMLTALFALSAVLPKMSPVAELAALVSFGTSVYVLLVRLGWPLYQWSSLRSLAAAISGNRAPVTRPSVQPESP